MATCPLCENTLDGDFGLVECSGCGAQLMIHVDGNVEFQGDDAPAVEASIKPGLTTVFPPQNFEESDEPPPPPEVAAIDEPSQLEVDSDPEETVPEPEPELDAEPQPAPVSEPEYNFDDDSPVEPAPPAYASAASPDSPDLRDVANFGNSDFSGGREGSLRYTLKIEGIDTSDVRNAFREAITDRKLMWDIETILRSVRNGEVTIQNVSPSKAFIVISRLRSLPLRVQWEQYAVSQT